MASILKGFFTEATQKLATETAQKVAKEAAEKAAKEAAEQAAKEAAQKLAKEAAEKLAKEAAEKAAREATEKAAKEAAEKGFKEGTEAAAKKGGKGVVNTIKKVAAVGAAGTLAYTAASMSGALGGDGDEDGDGDGDGDGDSPIMNAVEGFFDLLGIDIRPYKQTFTIVGIIILGIIFIWILYASGALGWMWRGIKGLTQGAKSKTRRLKEWNTNHRNRNRRRNQDEEDDDNYDRRD